MAKNVPVVPSKIARSCVSITHQYQKTTNGLPLVVLEMSGRRDLNSGPLRPERSALAGLSHAPCLLVSKRTRLYTTPLALTRFDISYYECYQVLLDR